MATRTDAAIRFSGEWQAALEKLQKLHAKGYKMNLLRKNITLSAGSKSVR